MDWTRSISCYVFTSTMGTSSVLGGTFLQFVSWERTFSAGWLLLLTPFLAMAILLASVALKRSVLIWDNLCVLPLSGNINRVWWWFLIEGNQERMSLTILCFNEGGWFYVNNVMLFLEEDFEVLHIWYIKFVNVYNSLTGVKPRVWDNLTGNTVHFHEIGYRCCLIFTAGFYGKWSSIIPGDFVWLLACYRCNLPDEVVGINGWLRLCGKLRNIKLAISVAIRKVLYRNISFFWVGVFPLRVHAPFSCLFASALGQLCRLLML